MPISTGQYTITDLFDGLDGKGVASIVEQYYLSTSNTSQAGGSWSSTVPAWVDGKYIWTRSVITYTDSSTVTTDPVCVTGGKGNTGNTGNGISAVDVEYYLSTSNTSQAGGAWSSTAPAWADGKYMWSRTKTTYTNGSTVYSTPACITGAKGSTGNGISSVTEYYLATSSASGVTTATAGWTTSIQTMTGVNKYLWNYEKITFTDASTSNTTPVVIGVYGDTGGTGATGKGISSVTEYYLATTASSGVTTATAGWTTTIQTVTATNKYLWNYEKITYTDSTTSTSSPVIIGVYGDKGDTGSTGNSYDIRYIRTQSQPSLATGNNPSGWSTSYPTGGYGNVWFVESVKDENGNLVGSWSNPALYENYDSNLLKNKPWVAGTDTVANGWNLNGASNIREIGATPFGGEDLIWRAVDNDTTSNDDGGWNHSAIPIDHTKTYRVSVWMKQLDASGTLYLGCDIGGNTYSLNGTVNGNPYFWTGKLPTLNEWYLVVGYIYGSGTTETVAHPFSGIYKGNTGENKYSSVGSFKNKVGAVYQTHRAYQYYSVTVGAESHFYAPRFDLCDGSEPSINELLRTGTKGDKGDTGNGISSVTEYYLASSSSSGITTATAGWSESVQTMTTTNKYLWNYEKITYTDSTIVNTTPVVIGTYGDTGGAGKGISTITEYYLTTSASSGVTRATTGWTTTIPTVTATNKYLWNYEKVDYVNPTSTVYVEPVIIGVYGDKGDKGDPGVSISSVTEYYLATSSSSGVTTATAGWTTTVQTITSSNKYLWNYEKITYSDSSTSTTLPVIIGTYGDTGGTGPTGKGISSITEYYLATTASSGVTTATAGWTTTIQTVTATNKYLWNYEKVTYTDSSTSTITPVIIGVYGDKGDKGDQGNQGPPGIAYMGTTAPSNPATSSTWFQTDSTGKIIAIQKYTGSAWTAAKMDSTTLSVDSLSALSATLGDVTTGTLTGVDITASTFNAKNGTSGTAGYSDMTLNSHGTNLFYYDGSIGVTTYMKDGTFLVEQYNSGLQYTVTVDKLGINIFDRTISTSGNTRLTAGKLDLGGTTITRNSSGGALSIDNSLVVGGTFTVDGDVNHSSPVYMMSTLDVDDIATFNGGISTQSFINATMVNGWVVESTDAYPAQYRKDPFGNVHIRGRFKGGTLNNTIFTLPVGYRPLKTSFFKAYGGSTETQVTRVMIKPTGEVTIWAGSNSLISIDGIYFKAEQ